MSDEATKKLEAEGDAAAVFLEELLDILDMDGDIDISVEAGRAKVAIVSEGPSQDLKRLVAEGTIAHHVARMFADDPNFRNYWRGLEKLFTNALLLAPSLD